jgi:hypothetical protein
MKLPPENTLFAPKKHKPPAPCFQGERVGGFSTGTQLHGVGMATGNGLDD